MNPGVTAFRLEGSSMFPLFRPGALVLVQAVSRGLSAGDCCVYEFEGRTLLHRVVGTGPGGAWLADDAGRISPHFVPWSGVRGKVLSKDPFVSGVPGRIYSTVRRAIAGFLKYA